MSATSIDLSQIKTDALSAASTFRTLIGLGTLATQSPTGTANNTTYLRGDFTWQTISSGGTWGSITGTLSSQTDLQSALDAKASLTGATFTGRITTPSVLLSGNYSAAAWTTSGVGLSHTARTLTDTSSSGTVAAAYTNVLGGNTIAASSSTTFTEYASLYIGSPTAGSNVTVTNAYSLITQGAVKLGGQLTLTQGTANASVFTSTGYSLTGSNAQSLIDLAGTWNTTGTPTAIKLNVTDTASNASSLLMDLQLSGSTKAKIAKDGTLTLAGPITLNQVNENLLNMYGGSYTVGLNSWEWKAKSGGGFTFVAAAPSNLGWLLRLGTNATASLFEIGLSGEIKLTSDTILARDAANTLAQRNSTNAQTFRIYNTYTDASNYERAKIAWSSNVLQIGTEKAGTGSARALELQTDGTTRLTLSTTGVATIPNTLDLTIRTVTYGATMAIDAALGNKIAITLTGNGTISNPSNAVDGRVLVFRLRQDGSGNRVPVWDTKYTFVGDLATVTLSTAANKIDRVAFEYDSTDDKWYCISFIKGS